MSSVSFVKVDPLKPTKRTFEVIIDQFLEKSVKPRQGPSCSKPDKANPGLT